MENSAAAPTELIDSVMGNLKALLQEMADEAQATEKLWRERTIALQNSRGGMHIFEPTDAEERAWEQEQRACDELYDKAQIIRYCMSLVARKVNNIIGENIVIQFSKWNM